MSGGLSILLLVTCATLSVGSLALGQEPATQPSNAPSTQPVEPYRLIPTAPDSVDEDLVDAAARPAGLLKYGPVSLVDPLWKDFNRFIEPRGLKVGLAYTAVYQVASGGPGDRDAAGGDADLFGDWRLLGPKGDPNAGYLYFAAEYRHDIITPIAPAALDTEIGSLWGTTNGFGEQTLALKEMYWQQHIEKDRLIARVGKIDAENYYNSNYWQSDSKYFMNQAFSSFPVRAFPSKGLGLIATAKLSDDYYVSTGFQDAQGKKTEAGFDTFFEDFNLFSAFELGFTPTLEGYGRGNYRFTAWYRDHGDTTGTPHDAGVDLSFDQHVGEHWVPFLRYGIGQGNINGIDQMVSGGVGWEGRLVTQSDVAGLAGSWGQPSDGDLDDQFALELFYRMQVSPDNQLTVGYQVICNPVFEPGDDVVGVFELRWRISM
jgi:hypothetical protein